MSAIHPVDAADIKERKRVFKLESALRKIAELHSCECGQLAFRADCTHHIAADALRRDDSQSDRETEKCKHGNGENCSECAAIRAARKSSQSDARGEGVKNEG